MNTSPLVQKLWNYCNVLRDDGMSYGDYVEQLTYLLFLKMADERSRPPYNQPSLIPAMVDAIAPKPGESVCDPACGTGGFLFTAHNYVTQHNPNLTRDEKRYLKEGAFRGWELVQGTARVCAMNLLLHGIGSEKSVPIKVADALAADPGERFEVVLANPPFGKKSSTMIVGENGRSTSEKDIIERDDFWATTSNKQLNFVQHIKTLLKPNGRAAVVVPDNVQI